MFWGISIIVIGIILYVTHTILLNYYLHKNAPDALKSEAKSKRKAHILIVGSEEGTIPNWVGLIGFPSIPLILFGIVVLVISLILKLFS